MVFMWMGREYSVSLVINRSSLSSDNRRLFRKPQEMLKPHTRPLWIFYHLLKHILLVGLGQPRIDGMLLTGLIVFSIQWFKSSNFSGEVLNNIEVLGVFT